jgi:hypothetical protein
MFAVARSTDAIVDAVTRLLDLLARPDDAELLAPLVVDEILIRLRVARVSWIREHFAQPPS